MMMNIRAILLRKKSGRFPNGRTWRNIRIHNKDHFTVIDKATNTVVWKEGEYDKVKEQEEKDDEISPGDKK